jgi:glycerophosphoryl diester phosphodiesterase
VHPEARLVTARLVAGARRARLALRAWTVDDPRELCRLRDLGIDAVLCNDPTAARQVLRQSRS